MIARKTAGAVNRFINYSASDFVVISSVLLSLSISASFHTSVYISLKSQPMYFKN